MTHAGAVQKMTLERGLAGTEIHSKRHGLGCKLEKASLSKVFGRRINMTSLPVSDSHLAAIARSLAFLCLHSEEGRKRQSVLAKAEFLMTLGLSVEESAVLVGSTVASIRELQRISRKKDSGNGKKSNGKEKARSRKDR